MTKDKSMLDVIHRNYKQELQTRIKMEKKKRRKECILAVMIGTFIVVVTALLLFANSNLEKSAMKNCINKGYSQNYCLNHV